MCYSLWCNAPPTGVHYTTSCNTQSSAPEVVQNNCPKYVELTGIINKPLLLHLVGCLYYLYFIIFFWELLNSLNLTLILKTWRMWWAPNNAWKWQVGFNSAFKGWLFLLITLFMPAYISVCNNSRTVRKSVKKFMLWVLWIYVEIFNFWRAIKFSLNDPLEPVFFYGGTC